MLQKITWDCLNLISSHFISSIKSKDPINFWTRSTKDIMETKKKYIYLYCVTGYNIQIINFSGVNYLLFFFFVYKKKVSILFTTNIRNILYNIFLKKTLSDLIIKSNTQMSVKDSAEFSSSLLKLRKIAVYLVLLYSVDRRSYASYQYLILRD